MLDLRSRGRGSSSADRGLLRSSGGPVAGCTRALGLLCQPSNVPAKFEVRDFSSPIPEIGLTAIGVLGSVANPRHGEEEAIRGRGWYRSKERW